VDIFIAPHFTLDLKTIFEILKIWKTTTREDNLNSLLEITRKYGKLRTTSIQDEISKTDFVTFMKMYSCRVQNNFQLMKIVISGSLSMLAQLSLAQLSPSLFPPAHGHLPVWTFSEIAGKFPLTAFGCQGWKDGRRP
jgi:hypothetical protein